MNNQTKNIDLTPDEIIIIVKAATVYPEIKRLIVFGSRALGNAKLGSDVDIALVGDMITPDIVSRFHDYLEEETLLPYFFDVVHLDSISNDNLRQHIDDHGKIIFAIDKI